MGSGSLNYSTEQPQVEIDVLPKSEAKRNLAQVFPSPSPYLCLSVPLSECHPLLDYHNSVVFVLVSLSLSFSLT